MTGWFSVHRKLKDNAIFSDPFILKLWMLCLMKVSYTEHEQLIGNQLVKLLPGEFITGRFALSDEYNKGMKKDMVVSERTLWRWMKKFEEWGMLSIKSTTKYSVITVVNWNQYQLTDQQVSSKCPATVQQVSTNNKGNTENKGNNKPSSRKQVYDVDSDYYKLADFMKSEIMKNSPNMKEPNLQKWANDFRLLIEVDKKKVPPAEIKSEVSRLIRWVQQDSFEMAVILSPSSLRRRYDSLILKMKNDSQPKQKEGRTYVKPKTYRPDSVDLGDEA